MDSLFCLINLYYKYKNIYMFRHIILPIAMRLVVI
jgi:hypothetical protein